MTDRGGAIRVLIADDHRVVREGIAALLRDAPDIDVVGTVGSGEDAVAFVAREGPHVVLMDIEMPGLGGTEATRRIDARFPDSRVVMLTSLSDREDVVGALAAGAAGFLAKEIGAEKLIEAVRAAAGDEPPLARATPSRPWPVDPTPQIPHLTTRERDVLALIAEGRSNKHIARGLGISEKTVKVHVGHILTRLGVDSRTQAALWARDQRRVKVATRETAGQGW